MNSTITNCDSVIELNLSFNSADSNFIYQDICVGDSIYFNGQYLSQNGTYYHNSTNISNCDSVVILNLNVQNNTSSQIYPVSCYSYTSPSGNYTWTQSGIYSDTISNIFGCDSIITIDLTINQYSTSSIQSNACRTYTSPSGNYTWTQSGIYTDTISNVAGCDSIINITLTIHDIDTTLSYNSPVLSSNQSNAITYQWIDCNISNFISGANSQTYTPNANSSYAVIVTTAYCLDTSECYNVTDVSISELLNSGNINIFPNPSFGEFSIEFDSEFEDLRIDLYSINGNIIRSDKYSNTNSINYNLNQAAGVYWIQIVSKNEIVGRFKLVKLK